MNPEAQRIAIAKACGWKRIRDNKGYKPANTHRIPDEAWMDNLPDYLSDLNAMHEAEKVLTQDQEGVFYGKLIQLEGVRSNWKTGEYKSISHATAAQRAEAFLRTLNLWTDQ